MNDSSFFIRCPYCFRQFSHDKVCFKAKTIFTRQDIESMGDGMIWNQSTLSYGAEIPDQSVVKKFIEKEDAEYKKFWELYPNSEPEWEYKNYPVITPESYEMMQNRNSYQIDADGFVHQVVDCFGQESDIRICPQCHNELPEDYGKHEVQTIALVGITHCGKTVYLSYLMENFSKIMSWGGMGTMKMGRYVDQFLEENKVERNEFLPQGTPPDRLSQPLFYRIKNERKTYTLVFYDIAGENCVTRDKMIKYGPFIRNAEGIILMLDPEQFLELRENVDCNVLEPEAVLSAMYSAFLGSDNIRGRSNKPLAVVFSKSDNIKKRSKEINTNSNMFRRIEYDKKGFQAEAHRDLCGELRGLIAHLSGGAAILELLKACFNNYEFFAVSVLDGKGEPVDVETTGGDKVTRYRQMNSPSAVRIEEPLFWILSQNGIISRIDTAKKSEKRGLIRRLKAFFKFF